MLRSFGSNGSEEGREGGSLVGSIDLTALDCSGCGFGYVCDIIPRSRQQDLLRKKRLTRLEK